MKSKWFLFLLIIPLFVLTGCPSGYYTGFIFTGINVPTPSNQDSLIYYNKDSDLIIRCGYYRQFIGEKGNGILTIINSNSKSKTEISSSTNKIESKNFGLLFSLDSIQFHSIPVYDSYKTTALFHLPINIKNENKRIKTFKEDTITIELAKGGSLLFTFDHENYLSQNHYRLPH